MSQMDLNPMAPFTGERALTIPEHVLTTAMFVLSGMSAVLTTLLAQGQFDEPVEQGIALFAAVVAALMAWLASWNNIPDQK